MNLDEAIKHAEEKGQGTDACSEDHKQLAIWLKELRDRRKQGFPESPTLSKAICKKCLEAERMHERLDGRGWRDFDENTWFKGFVHCHQNRYADWEGWKGAPINEPPPDWCPHKLKHAVAAGMTKPSETL